MLSMESSKAILLTENGLRNKSLYWLCYLKFKDLFLCISYSV